MKMLITISMFLISTVVFAVEKSPVEIDNNAILISDNVEVYADRPRLDNWSMFSMKYKDGIVVAILEKDTEIEIVEVVKLAASHKKDKRRMVWYKIRAKFPGVKLLEGFVFSNYDYEESKTIELTRNH